MASFRWVISPCTRGTLSSFRSACSHLPPELKTYRTGLFQRNITMSTQALKVLNESTVFVQDGTNIREFPVLIGRADRTSSFPFTSHSYTGENIRDLNEFESSFKQVLQDCATVSDVFKLLEVPSDKVQGYSAAFALQRLHALMYLNTEWLQIHSFIRTAVMKELYETVQRDIQLVSNSTLVSLVDCYLAAQGFSPSCIDAINDEISHRLVAGVFSLEEILCLVQSLTNASSSPSENVFPPSIRDHPSLSEILFQNASKYLSSIPPEKIEPFDKFAAKSSPASRETVHQKCNELLRNAWVHLATRYQELNENTLPLTMHLLPAERKNLVCMLVQPMTRNRYHLHLSAEGVALCLNGLLRLHIHNTTMMTNMGQWGYVNIHLITPSLLLSLLNVFIHFAFIDNNIIRIMERCLQKSGLETPTDLLALCVEYLHSFKHSSPVILDLAADHFTNHWESYAPLEMFAVLRAFGHLRYLPSQCQDFLRAAEECLHKRFDILEEAHLLEVLASFTFIDVVPKNFYRRITSDQFYKKIIDLPQVLRMQARVWLKFTQHAFILPSLDDQTANRNWVLAQRYKLNLYSYLSETERIGLQSVKHGLNSVFGPKFHHSISFYNCLALYVDDKGIPLEITKDENGLPTPIGEVSERLALVPRSISQCCRNTNQLLGAQAQRLAHLEHIGFTPVEIHLSDVICFSITSVLQSYLSSHVDFSLAEVKQLVKERSKEEEREKLALSFDLLEEEEGGKEVVVTMRLRLTPHNLTYLRATIGNLKVIQIMWRAIMTSTKILD